MIAIPHYADRLDLAGGFREDLREEVGKKVWGGDFTVTDTHIEFQDGCGEHDDLEQIVIEVIDELRAAYDDDEDDDWF